MHVKQTIKIVLKKIQKLHTWIKVLIISVFVVVCLYLITFLSVKSVQFSYSQPTCVSQITLLPDTSKQVTGDSGFDVINEDAVKLNGISLLSLKTCFIAKKAPTVGNEKVSVAPYGISWFAKKTFELSIPQSPDINLDILNTPILTTKSLSISLDAKDLVYSYRLIANDKIADCPIKDSAIVCDIAALGLAQGKSYDIELDRMFNQQKVQIIIKQTITTLSAVSIVSSSISSGQKVYDAPKVFTFTFDKDVISGDIKLEKVEGDKRTAVTLATSFSDKLATATIVSDLERSAAFEFTIDNVIAKDSSTLPDAYKLDFDTSGGPNVASVNVGRYGLPTTQTIVLTFDSTLSEGQDITKFITTTGIPTSISKSGNQVFIRYTDATVCTDLNINIKTGILSSYNVPQNNTWSFSTRTICHDTSTIGYSVEGRPIIAYTFGSGSQTILYIGNIHGNEKSTKYLMDAWVDELELNARNIPADKTIVVVSTMNPDGFAADRRNNSNNVDLNRNFPTIDWQTDIVDPANQPVLGGGGATALSEPESQAIENFTYQLNPRLIVSFHGNAGYAIGNQTGDSAALAAQYADLTGYQDMTGDGGAFSYPITGTYDTWLQEECGLPSVIVELSSNTNSQFNTNKAALWVMARS